MRAPLAAGVCLCLGLLASTGAMAQKRAWPELVHAERGARAYESGDYDAAIRHFRRALLKREVNVLYLNLGLSLLRAGQCSEASVAFDAALSALETPQMSASAAREHVDAYREEAAEQCEGTLSVECTDPELSIFIDGLPHGLCHGVAVSLRPGTHTLEARQGAQLIERRVVRVVGLRQVGIAIDSAPMVVLSAPKRGSVSYWWISAGILLGGTGLLMDLVPESSRDGQLGAIDFVPAGLYAVGLTSLSVGFMWR